MMVQGSTALKSCIFLVKNFEALAFQIFQNAKFLNSFLEYMSRKQAY